MDTMTDFIETNGKISHREDQVDSDKTSVLYVLLQNYKKKLKILGRAQRDAARRPTSDLKYILGGL